MSPSEIASAVRWRLASDIETELASQERVAERIATLRSRLASEPGDWVVAAAMAFEVERWYTAVESLFLRILRTLDGEVPTGPAHHRELVRAAALSVEPLRPALLPPAAENDFRELLGFRHSLATATTSSPSPHACWSTVTASPAARSCSPRRWQSSWSGCGLRVVRQSWFMVR